MNKSFDIWVSSSNLSNGYWNPNVWLFKIFFSGTVRLWSNTINNGILFSDDVGNVLSVCKVSQLNICFVTKISSWFDFLELIIPNGGLASIWVDDCRSDSGELWTYDHTKNAGSTKHCSINTWHWVSSTLVIKMNSLELIVSSWGINQHRLLCNLWVW